MWDRTVNRGELVEFFGISTQQASADLSVYLKLAPRNLKYDKNAKTYRATAAFKPMLARDEAQTFLSQLLDLSIGALPQSSSFLGWRPPLDFVRLPVRPIVARTLIRLLWAIRDGEDLSVSYQSMRQPGPTTRWIAPHALAHDGLRWHVRAWCHDGSDFRDFVISRIQRIDSSRTATVSSDKDMWWHTFVEVVIRARPGLTEAQRLAIELDFGMTSGRLVISCRKALTFYLLRQLQLDRLSDLPVAAQPLELVNRDELSEVINAARKTPEEVLTPRTRKLETRHD
jgi:hypothetical protein